MKEDTGVENSAQGIGNMARIASINTNKRLNTRTASDRFGNWLQRQQVDLVVNQEPSTSSLPPVTPDGYTGVGGNNRIYCWVRNGRSLPKCHLVADWLQRLDLGELIVYNVYLDAYRRQTRAEQLVKLTEELGTEANNGKAILVLGDFNLAPALEDGLYGGQPSTYNSDVERRPLRRMLQLGRLVDLGQGDTGRQWTLERLIGGKLSQFRCDLALISDRLAKQTRLGYDHGVRVGAERFTDHSALLVDVPLA